MNPRNNANLPQVHLSPFSLHCPDWYSPTSEYSPYPTCGICFEPFQATHSPISAALTANSSAHLQFGLRLPCPRQHPYCISCLAEYIRRKLDPSGTGDVNAHIPVFPICCPECPITRWETGIQDDVAEDGESMSAWVCPDIDATLRSG